MKDVRRQSRIPFVGPVRISWGEPAGQARYAQASCLDISESGLRVESPWPIALRTRVSLNVERLGVAGRATVRHSARHGSRYILGLELSQSLDERVRDRLREPWSIRKPSPMG